MRNVAVYRYEDQTTRISKRGRSPISSSVDLVVTREMREAGAAVLVELEGEASNEYQAQQVFEAMLRTHLLSN
jgi:hypothetical protein